MSYPVSFRTTLRISRYLLRVLALLLWTFGVVLTIFYIINIIRNKESEVYQQFNVSYGQAEWSMRRATSVTQQLKLVSEHFLAVNDNDVKKNGAKGLNNGQYLSFYSSPRFYPLYRSSNCADMERSWHNSFNSMRNWLQYWGATLSFSYKLNRIVFYSLSNRCLFEQNISDTVFDHDNVVAALRENVEKKYNSREYTRPNNLIWTMPESQAGIWRFYMLVPLYKENEVVALMGSEQYLRPEDFLLPGALPMDAILVDQQNNLLLSSVTAGAFNLSELSAEPTWFGYVNNYKQLILKRKLVPSGLSIIYSTPTSILFRPLKTLAIHALLLNIISALLLMILTWLFDRRLFLPAFEKAHRLEEHEQLNRKIVASAPVGISILRVSDGSNILSNELAHNYLNMLSQQDRRQLTEMICRQRVNFVDVMTGSNTNLQISFVHSRYANESVAICVLVDVSARVKMEESLQEMAQAAEQASQSKSMFLATVSHELRTPLYGIIGNLDLLQTRALPKEINSLVAAMNSSSALLLKIISDILDFSKIESEQLRIEPRKFSPREVISHVTVNYLSLIVKKRLALYVLIDSNVPVTLEGDGMRLQQVISNLLSNAIKFTHIGGVTLQVSSVDGYLVIGVRDTGVGIPVQEIHQLFDPFFQISTEAQGQRNFQGTGLGLAICEKLINMMDGDIKVESQPGMGSQFIVRIPLYNSRVEMPVQHPGLANKRCWLVMHNDILATWLISLLTEYGIMACRDEGICATSGEVVVSDHSCDGAQSALALILFDNQHIGDPLEYESGKWIISTATPHLLPTLLEYIHQVGIALPSGSSPLSAMLSGPGSNDDILILVVDDHPINRMLLSEQLGSLGYRVKTAQDGIDALNHINHMEMDIILTDVNMPNMDGYLLAQRLRQLDQALPIIGVTANALAEEKQRCMEAGMDDCLAKPVTLEILRQILSRYAQQVRAGRLKV